MRVDFVTVDLVGVDLVAPNLRSNQQTDLSKAKYLSTRLASLLHKSLLCLDGLDASHSVSTVKVNGKP